MPSKPGRPATSTTRKGNGPGWGGAARGAGNGNDGAPPFAEGNPGYADAGGAAGGSRPTEKSAAKAERIERLKDNLEQLAFNAEQEAVRVAATDKLLDRLEGKPIQRQITGDLNDLERLSDEEIDARLAALEAKLGAAR